MASEPYILGFDTSAAHCAAALLCGGRLVSARTEELGRGQAERLFPLLEEVLAEGGVTWSDLTRIGVGVGPGNFTGIRISVSAARGLALALDIPAIGVSTFDAISHDQTVPHLPAVPAPRDQIYVRRPEHAPELTSRDAAEATNLPVIPPPDGGRLAEAIARVAALAPADAPKPAPLYVKPADAAPSRDTPPVILDDAG